MHILWFKNKKTEKITIFCLNGLQFMIVYDIMYNVEGNCFLPFYPIHIKPKSIGFGAFMFCRKKSLGNYPKAFWLLFFVFINIFDYEINGASGCFHRNRLSGLMTEERFAHR